MPLSPLGTTSDTSLNTALDWLVAESADAGIFEPSSLLEDLRLVSPWLTSVTDVGSLREEVRMIKVSSVSNVEKVVRLNSKLCELECAAVQTKAVNYELGKHLVAAGYRILGSRSELFGSGNKLDFVKLEMEDIRRDAEDAEVAART